MRTRTTILFALMVLVLVGAPSVVAQPIANQGFAPHAYKPMLVDANFGGDMNFRHQLNDAVANDDFDAFKRIIAPFLARLFNQLVERHDRLELTRDLDGNQSLNPGPFKPQPDFDRKPRPEFDQTGCRLNPRPEKIEDQNNGFQGTEFEPRSEQGFGPRPDLGRRGEGQPGCGQPVNPINGNPNGFNQPLRGPENPNGFGPNRPLGNPENSLGPHPQPNQGNCRPDFQPRPFNPNQGSNPQEQFLPLNQNPQ